MIEAGIIKGHRATSYKSIKTGVINAGGQWMDEQVVTDQGLITSRQPSGLDAQRMFFEAVGLRSMMAEPVASSLRECFCDHALAALERIFHPA